MLRLKYFLFSWIFNKFMSVMRPKNRTSSSTDEQKHVAQLISAFLYPVFVDAPIYVNTKTSETLPT